MGAYVFLFVNLDEFDDIKEPIIDMAKIATYSNHFLHQLHFCYCSSRKNMVVFTYDSPTVVRNMVSSLSIGIHTHKLLQIIQNLKMSPELRYHSPWDDNGWILHQRHFSMMISNLLKVKLYQMKRSIPSLSHKNITRNIFVAANIVWDCVSYFWGQIITIILAAVLIKITTSVYI